MNCMDLVLGSRFAAMFFAAGVVPNPIDIRFQRVSGLTATIETTTLNEGGQNLYSHRLPKRVGYSNLVLERGFVVGSPLNIEFDVAMSLFKFVPSQRDGHAARGSTARRSRRGCFSRRSR